MMLGNITLVVMFIIIWYEYAEIKYFSENLNKKYREKRL